MCPLGPLLLAQSHVYDNLYSALDVAIVKQLCRLRVTTQINIVLVQLQKAKIVGCLQLPL